jgi:hypothetical protein
MKTIHKGMHRRHFIHATLASALAVTLRAADTGRPPRILLRSSWQVVNIGDIAHTPGVLALIEKHLPDAEVRLWASADLSEEVAAMEHQRFPNEMHSPIMCIGNGIPAIVCRFSEQTSKGFMWRDIGLGNWLFDLDREEEVRRIVPAVLAMTKDPATAQTKAAQAREFVRRRQRETMALLARNLTT